LRLQGYQRQHIRITLRADNREGSTCLTIQVALQATPAMYHHDQFFSKGSFASGGLDRSAFAIATTGWNSNRRPRHPLYLNRTRLGVPSNRTAKWQMHTSSSNSSSTIDNRVIQSLSNRVVVITGGTGLIGRALVHTLRQANARVVVLARNPHKAKQLFAENGSSPPSVLKYSAETILVSENVVEALSAADVVVNLAGEPVDEGRWTTDRKKALWASRVNGTDKLVKTLRQQDSDAVFVSASAVGFYGPSETKTFTEESQPGTDFLATLAVAWEQAALANVSGSRTVVLRIGVVLGSGGGALEKMSAAFRAFLGGPPGGGSQWFSWVHIDDVVRLILHASVDEKWEGVYNCTSPQPVRLAQFCSELGRALGRPSWLPVPRQAVQALLGNEAAQLILAGQQVIPKRTRANGFIYRYKDVTSALQQLTKPNKSTVSNSK